MPPHVASLPPVPAAANETAPVKFSLEAFVK